MSFEELNGASNPGRNPAIAPYMHFTLKERRKIAVLQRRMRYLSDKTGDHDQAEFTALSWALGILANTELKKRCDKCQVTWTAPVWVCPECGDRIH